MLTRTAGFAKSGPLLLQHFARNWTAVASESPHQTNGMLVTSQCPEVLVVENGCPGLTGLQLYGIRVGDIDNSRVSKRYVFSSSVSAAKIAPCSALWRGYVSVYRLRPDSTLILERRDFPFNDGVPPDEVGEVLQGDFWLEFRSWFMGDSVKVPFRDGKMELDQSVWRRKAGLPLPRKRS